MAKTKRSKRSWSAPLLVLLSIAAAGALGYAGGIYLGFLNEQHKQNALAEQAQHLQEQLAAAQKDAAIYKTNADVAERAQENIRLELKEYREQIIELEKAASFYQNVLGAGQAAGLALERFFVSPLEENGMYSFQLMLAQHSHEPEQVSGTVTLVVVGEQEGEKAELSQEDVLFDDGASLAFSFSYFQELKGRLALPEGFVPQSVRVIAKRAGANAGSVTQFFKWEHGE